MMNATDQLGNLPKTQRFLQLQNQLSSAKGDDASSLAARTKTQRALAIADARVYQALFDLEDAYFEAIPEVTDVKAIQKRNKEISGLYQIIISNLSDETFKLILGLLIAHNEHDKSVERVKMFQQLLHPLAFAIYKNYAHLALNSEERKRVEILFAVTKIDLITEAGDLDSEANKFQVTKEEMDKQNLFLHAATDAVKKLSSHVGAWIFGIGFLMNLLYSISNGWNTEVAYEDLKEKVIKYLNAIYLSASWLNPAKWNGAVSATIANGIFAYTMPQLMAQYLFGKKTASVNHSLFTRVVGWVLASFVAFALANYSYSAVEISLTPEGDEQYQSSLSDMMLGFLMAGPTFNVYSLTFLSGICDIISGIGRLLCVGSECNSDKRSAYRQLLTGFFSILTVWGGVNQARLTYAHETSPTGLIQSLFCKLCDKQAVQYLGYLISAVFTATTAPLYILAAFFAANYLLPKTSENVANPKGYEEMQDGGAHELQDVTEAGDSTKVFHQQGEALSQWSKQHYALAVVAAWSIAWNGLGNGLQDASGMKKLSAALWPCIFSVIRSAFTCLKFVVELLVSLKQFDTTIAGALPKFNAEYNVVPVANGGASSSVDIRARLKLLPPPSDADRKLAKPDPSLFQRARSVCMPTSV